MAEARTPRDELREGLSSYLTPDQIKQLIDDVLAIKKSAWANCPKCNKRVTCEVSDAKGVASSLKDLLAEGFGRPKESEPEGERIVFQRLVDFSGADSA